MHRFTALALWLPFAAWGQLPGSETAMEVAKAHFGELLRSGSVRAGGFAEISDSGTSMDTYGDMRRESLWRAASTTKALTALAILRLAETGRVDLDADVNRYLKRIQVPTGTGAVTIRDLLGHTSGLDDPFVDSAYISGPQPPLTDVMRDHMPERIFAPGEARLYSNYGYGILGSVIEEVTGQKYQAYMRKEILTPIGMASSTFVQPLPPSLERRVVRTTERSVFGFVRPCAILYHRSVSGGGLTTTLGDLAVFAGWIQNEARLDSQGYGFGFGTNRGQKYWYAGGDLGGYHTVILWFPEHRRAMVVAAASDSTMSTWGLVPKVMQKWFGEPEAAGDRHSSDSAAAVSQVDVAGIYRPVRYPHRDIGKTFIVASERAVTRNADQSLSFQGRRWRATEAMRFRDTAGDEVLTFRWTKNGQLLLNREFERIAWYASGRVAIGAYFGFLIASLFAIWRCRKVAGLQMLRWTALSIAIHSVAWLGAVLAADPQRLILGLPWYVSAATSAGWLCLAPWLMLAATTAIAVRNRSVSRGQGLGLCAATIGLGWYVPFLWYWRIV